MKWVFIYIIGRKYEGHDGWCNETGTTNVVAGSSFFFGKLAWKGCRTVVTSSRESKCSNMPPSTEQQRPARWSLIWGWWLLFSAVVKNVTCNGSPSQLCVLKYRKNVNTQRIRFCENKIRKWNYQLGTTLVLPIQHSPPSRRRSSRTCKDGLE